MSIKLNNLVGGIYNGNIYKNNELLILIHFKFCICKKKSFKYNIIYKASKVNYPLFHRKVIIFRLRGTFIKKHYSVNSMNQTITLECNISKNKFLLTSPTNPKGISIF